MADRFLRLAQVEDLIGRSGTSIYRDARNGTFPKPAVRRPRYTAWLESEVQAWMEAVLEESKAA